MEIDLAALPDDVETQHHLIGDLVAAHEHERAEASAEIDRLRHIVKLLQRYRFGRRSERLDSDQILLGLDDVDADIGRAEVGLPASTAAKAEAAASPGERPALPSHLERENVRLDIDTETCPACGGTIHQAPAPERPIAKSLASPGLLAHVLVSKYCDHQPLYHQSQIFARHGIRLNRSTLATWVGGATWWLEPLHSRLAEHMFDSTKLFADDTPIPVLDPGAGERGPDGYGSMCAMTGRGTAPTNQQLSTSTAPTAGLNGRPAISKASAASCRSMATPASSS